jgi:hypothetical protein
MHFGDDNSDNAGKYLNLIPIPSNLICEKEDK